jgi:hypothetical protein
MNLLYETIEVLAENGKALQDIVAIGNCDYSMTLEEFIRLANVEYDDDYGAQEVAEDLYLVGEDFWLERFEYDGAESWRFKKKPEVATDGKKIKYLTVGQCEAATGKYLCGWLTLAEMNEMEGE